MSRVRVLIISRFLKLFRPPPHVYWSGKGLRLFFFLRDPLPKNFGGS